MKKSEGAAIVCELCGGEGLIKKLDPQGLPTRIPGRFEPTYTTQVCICKRNQLVGLTYPCLAGIPMDQALIKKAMARWDPSKNYMVLGGYDIFMKAVKAMFVGMSKNKAIRFLMLNGSEMVKDYYVAQEDNSGRSERILKRDVDFLVFRIESRAANKAMQPLLAEVLQTRLNNRKVTWVWCAGDPQEYQEWSPLLSGILYGERYTLVDMNESAKERAKGRISTMGLGGL